MSAKPTDPLLAAAKVLLTLVRIAIVIGVTALSFAIVMVTVFHTRAIAEMAKEGVPGDGIWLIGLALLTGLGMLFLAYRFVGELSGIINSVGEGDPFRPENAARLSRMGWIMVAIQVMVLPVAALAMWFARYADKLDANIHTDGGLDFGSILLTLILFILARVFREGTRMREELEGTV